MSYNDYSSSSFGNPYPGTNALMYEPALYGNDLYAKPENEVWTKVKRFFRSPIFWFSLTGIAVVLLVVGLVIMIVLTVVASSLPPTTANVSKPLTGALASSASSSLLAITRIDNPDTIPNPAPQTPTIQDEPEIGNYLPMNKEMYYITSENGDSSIQNRLSAAGGKLEVNSNNDADIFQKWITTVYGSDDGNTATYLIQTPPSFGRQYGFNSNSPHLVTSVGYSEEFHWDITLITKRKSVMNPGNPVFTISKQGKYLTYKPNKEGKVTWEAPSNNFDYQMFSFVLA